MTPTAQLQAVVPAGGNVTKRVVMRRSSSLSNSLGISGATGSASSTPRRLPSDSTTEPIVMAGEVSVYESQPHPDEDARASTEDDVATPERRSVAKALALAPLVSCYAQCLEWEGRCLDLGLGIPKTQSNSGSLQNKHQ